MLISQILVPHQMALCPSLHHTHPKFPDGAGYYKLLPKAPTAPPTPCIMGRMEGGSRDEVQTGQCLTPRASGQVGPPHGPVFLPQSKRTSLLAHQQSTTDKGA